MRSQWQTLGYLKEVNHWRVERYSPANRLEQRQRPERGFSDCGYVNAVGNWRSVSLAGVS